MPENFFLADLEKYTNRGKERIRVDLVLCNFHWMKLKTKITNKKLLKSVKKKILPLKMEIKKEKKKKGKKNKKKASFLCNRGYLCNSRLECWKFRIQEISVSSSCLGNLMRFKYYVKWKKELFRCLYEELFRVFRKIFCIILLIFFFFF